MIDMKDQCFGVEVEFTGITREQAAEVLAGYFGTTPRHKGGTYGTWVVRGHRKQRVETGERLQYPRGTKRHRTVMRELETGTTGWRWFPQIDLCGVA